MPRLRTICLVVLAGLLALGVSGCKRSASRPKTLNVFNWSDYIDPELIKEFESKHGCKVQYDTYSADADLENKLASGAEYDVVFPSDRSLAPLLKRGLLQKLDRSKLSNLGNLNPASLGVRHDPRNEYTLPYFEGTLAVGIRTDRVTKPVKGFEILFDEELKGKIVLLDDAEHVVAMALLHLGRDMNSVADDDLAAARDLLQKQRPLVQAWSSDGFKDKLIKGEAWAALGWSGDLLQARDQLAETGKGSIAVVVPASGTLRWVDSMAIPTAAKNVELAHAFIDFLLDPAVAARNAAKVRYATPNKAAFQRLDESLKKDPVVYPPAEIMHKCGYLKDRGKDIKKIEEVWKAVRH